MLFEFGTRVFQNFGPALGFYSTSIERISDSIDISWAAMDSTCGLKPVSF